MHNTRQRHYLPTLDFIRAAATLLVMSFHFWQQSWVSPVVQVGPLRLDCSAAVVQGDYGMIMLFVLSGFGLMLPYAMNPDAPFSWKDYARKRLARILPTYYLSVCIGAAFQLGRLAPDVLREQFLGNLFFLQMSTPGLSYNMLNGVLWSVAIEVQFYLLFPLLRLAIRKKPVLTVSLSLLVGEGMRAYFGQFRPDRIHFWRNNQMHCFIDIFVLGMAAACVYGFVVRHKRQSRDFLGLIALGAALLIVAFRYTHAHRYDDVAEIQTRLRLCMRLPVALGTCCILLGAELSGGWSRVVFGNRIVKFFAEISFQIYLWHMLIALRLKELHIPAYTAELPMYEERWRMPYLLLCLILTFVLATATTCAVEKPLYRLLTRSKKERD